MHDSPAKPKANEMIVLRTLPHGLLDGLPEEDQQAIRAVVGKPILLLGYDAEGRAELEFTDSEGVLHAIFVKSGYLSRP